MVLAGLVFTVVAAAFVAIAYLAMKQVNAGDGVFFCACESIGVAVVGLLVHFALANSHQMHFEAAWGGVAWMLGLLLTPKVIDLLGVGVAVAILDSVDLLVGWATSRFGFFGVEWEGVASPLPHYSGIGVTCVSCVLMIWTVDDLKPQEASGCPAQACRSESKYDDVEAPSPTKVQAMESESTRADSEAGPTSEGALAITECSGSGLLNISGAGKASGVLLAVVAGLLQGTKYAGSVHLMQRGLRGEDFSTHMLDHVFSFYCGIAATGALALAIYLATQRSKSYTPRKIVLPALLAGILWGTASVFVFKASEDLEMVVVYPLFVTIIASIALFSGFFYGEFVSLRAKSLAAVGTVMRIAAVILIAVSGGSN